MSKAEKSAKAKKRTHRRNDRKDAFAQSPHPTVTIPFEGLKAEKISPKTDEELKTVQYRRKTKKAMKIVAACEHLAAGFVPVASASIIRSAVGQYIG